MTDVLTDYFSNLMKGFLSTLNRPEDYLNKIALSAVIIIIVLLLRHLLKKGIKHNVSDFKTRVHLLKAIKNGMITLTVLSIVFIWIQAMNALVLLLLLIGFFIVVMVRGLANNIIAHFVIRSRKYFKVGHRVEINDVIGDVVEIDLISFKLLEVRNDLSSDANTGRIIKLPNKIIFEESIEMIGVTNTLISHELKYVLSFDSDWQDAERIITDAGDLYFKESIVPLLKESKEHLPNEEEHLSPVFSLNISDEGIVLVLRYLVDYRNGTRVKTKFQRDILNKFSENKNIKFAALDIRILSK